MKIKIYPCKKIKIIQIDIVKFKLIFFVQFRALNCKEKEKKNYVTGVYSFFFKKRVKVLKTAEIDKNISLSIYEVCIDNRLVDWPKD